MRRARVDQRPRQRVRRAAVRDDRRDRAAHAPDEVVGLPAPPRALGDLRGDLAVVQLRQRDRVRRRTRARERPALADRQLAGGPRAHGRVGVVEQLAQQRGDPRVRLAAAGALGPQRRAGRARGRHQRRALLRVERAPAPG